MVVAGADGVVQRGDAFVVGHAGIFHLGGATEIKRESMHMNKAESE